MIISIFLILVGLIILIYQIYISKYNSKIILESRNDNNKICFLIPARDESKVIRNILDSIKTQTYKIDMKNVYVIVEDKNDETINICSEYNASVIIRKKPIKHRKGFALDEAIKAMDEKYDMYFIFDADNMLDKNFIKEMIKTYKKGYDIGVGYRNSKNGDKNIISACSTLTFSMINQLINEKKALNGMNITISGTGFYISGEYINKWGGYPFNTLTEDYELTLYSIENNLSSDYNKNAIYYDEQPVDMKTSINQRTRWIKGFFTARKKYISRIQKSIKKSNINIVSKKNEINIIRSIILMVLGVFIFIIYDIYSMIIKNSIKYLILLICIFLLVYLILQIFTIIILNNEEAKLNLSSKTKIKCIFFNPIFLSSYLICLFKAFTKREVKWTKIDHNETNIIK